MEIEQALRAFAALSSETRFWVLRLLLQAGPAGLSAGELAESLGARQNTLSTHLKILKTAGLIDSRRAGRRVLYRGDPQVLAGLGAFLTAEGGEDPRAPGRPWRPEAQAGL